MRVLFILALFSLAMTCQEKCPEEIEITQKEGAIFGTWQLTGTYQWIGEEGCPYVWREVKNGYTFTIHTDSSFVSSQFSECEKGKATLSPKEIKLTYECDNLPDDFEGQGVLRYNFRWVLASGAGTLLEFTPLHIRCYEGCKDRFVKIK